MKNDRKNILSANIEKLSNRYLSPLDLLAHTDFREKCIDLVLNGIPENIDHTTAAHFHELRQYLSYNRVEGARVVVFGGGTGLSNIIGGDSRLSRWSLEPFTGLKEVFPKTRSIVCVTDDGGSTGQLIKDLPLIALGDIRHVLLSSMQLTLLQKKYSLTLPEALQATSALALIFNTRFKVKEISKELVNKICSIHEVHLPAGLNEYISNLVTILFSDRRLAKTLSRPHCLGNLLLVAAVYKYISSEFDNARLEKERYLINTALYKGINEVSEAMGAVERSVLPCTTTPSQLRICYTNGIQVTGEDKSGTASRGFPVDRVVVDFSDTVHVPPQIFEDIEAADIIILAPGSLYSSIIPVFQVPGIADAVRNNEKALKLLISNLWVQAGETDIAVSDPDRKFHVSDMIRAYEHNIPGGTKGLFREVLCLSLKDVPASILQNYALEGKIPIYLDKQIVYEHGYVPIECGIYSKKALAERGVIQHDPEILAQAIKTVYSASEFQHEISTFSRVESIAEDPDYSVPMFNESKRTMYPSEKYRLLQTFIDQLPITYTSSNLTHGHVNDIRERIVDVIWKHQDISIKHLKLIKGIRCVDKEQWRREQKWDNVFTFYDPDDANIKIRSDQLFNIRKLEIALLIAIGQSLLGNYAAQKEIENVIVDKVVVGKIYHLHIRKEEDIISFFSSEELDEYLHLARMNKNRTDPSHYTRLISGNDGFTPPGVLMGLTYAWYLDNRLASHIEYKMSLMKIDRSDLIPEQLKMLKRRHAIVNFFRDTVFN